MIESRLDVAIAAPVFHGGTPALDRDDSAIQLDFSTNVNAFGPPPAVLHALAEADPAAYPDPTARTARKAFAGWSGLPVDRVALTAGACDAIDRIARAFLASGDTVLIAAPAFSEYARAAAMAGATVHEVRDCERRVTLHSQHRRAGGTQELPASPRTTPPPSDMMLGGGCTAQHTDPSIERILSALRNVRPRLLFLAAPSSPLGVTRPVAEIDAVADSVRGHGMLVLDESYAAFTTGVVKPPSRAERDDVVHVRSITKDFALAGVRAGFVIARPEIIDAIRAAGPPWAASAPAQAAAAAAFMPSAIEHVARTIRVLRSERARLASAFAAHGAVPLPGDTHVLCVRVGHADVLTARLRQLGIRIRPCASFGWPDVVRVAARLPRENEVLIERLTDAGC